MSESGEPELSRKLPSEDAIQAVSDLLSQKKPALEQPSFRPSLPKFPGSLDSAISGLKKDPSLRAKFTQARTSIEPPPVSLLEPNTPARSEGEVAPIIESLAALPSRTADVRTGALTDRSVAEGQRSEPFVVGSNRSEAGSAIPGASLDSHPFESRVAPASTFFGDRPGASSDPVESFRPRNGRTEDQAANSGPENSRGSSPVILPTGSPALDRVSVSQGSVPPPRGVTSSGSQTVADRGSASKPIVGPGPLSVTPARSGPTSIAVRNPFSSGSRSLPVESEDSLGSAPSASGFDMAGMGSGSGDRGFGDSSGSSGGASVDLSKTNELLRELVDVVKRQRDTSLPVGGPSVYPAR